MVQQYCWSNAFCVFELNVCCHFNFSKIWNPGWLSVFCLLRYSLLFDIVYHYDCLVVPRVQTIVFCTKSLDDSENETIVNASIDYVNTIQPTKSPFRLSPPLLPLSDVEIDSEIALSGKFLKFPPSRFSSGCFVAIISREVSILSIIIICCDCSLNSLHCITSSLAYFMIKCSYLWTCLQIVIVNVNHCHHYNYHCHQLLDRDLSSAEYIKCIVYACFYFLRLVAPPSCTLCRTRPPTHWSMHWFWASWLLWLWLHNLLVLSLQN